MASASSVLRSANSLRNTLATYQDSLMAYEYSNSAYTDTALSSYSDYLNQRIDALNATGTVANASKALQLTKALESAQKSNISATISRESDQVMQGNATLQDKYNVIVQQYQRAQGIGDLTLAQSLASRADSLSQTMQYQQQVANDNAITLAKAQGASSDSVATQLTDSLRQLNADVGAGGMAEFNAKAKAWVATNKDQLTTLADSLSASPDAKAAILKAINTSQPGYQDIVAGVTNAIIIAHTTAANAVAPYDPAEAQVYYNQASAVANGQTKIDTLAGSLSAQDIMTWQQQPGMFIPHENTTGGKLSFTYKSASLQSGESSISGYQFDQNGNLVPVFTGQEAGHQVTSDEAASINAQLKKLGFSFKDLKANDNLNNGITVQFTGSTPAWLRKAANGQQNLTTQLYVTKQGLQFGSLDSSGNAHGYLIAQDSSGKNALYNGSNNNGQLVFNKQNAAGDYGFNQVLNSAITSGSNGSNGNTLTGILQNVKQNIFSSTPTANGKVGTPPTNQSMGPLAVKPTMTQRAGGGFNFEYNGQAISAAKYSQLTGTPFRDLLTTMSNQGDMGAKLALGFVGNDYGYDPTKAAAYQNSGAYNALTWGAGVKAAPAQAPASVLGNGAALHF